MSSPKVPSAHRYWDDVTDGDTLPGFSIALTWTALALQVSGSQDWSTVHRDPDYSRSSGHQAPFFNTGWTAGMLGRVLSDWAGPSGWVCSLTFRMRQMNSLGDTASGRGRVVAKRIANDGRRLVDVDVWLENERLGITTPGTATLSLPFRAGPS